MTNKGQNKTGLVVFLLFMLYVIQAMSDNFKGIVIPSLKMEFGINNTQIGYFLIISMLSFAVFQFVGGILIEKYGKKKVLQLGFILTIGSLGLLLISKSYFAIIASLFGVNAGVAMFGVVVSTLGPALPVASTAVLMNMIAFTYGASATVIQKVSGKLLLQGYDWRNFFGFMMAFSAVLFVYLMFIKIPESENLGSESNEKINLMDVLKDKMVWLYIGCLGFYLASEMGTGNWFGNYMNEAYSFNPDARGFYVSLFFGVITLGRLAGGFVAEKVGYLKSIIVFSLLSCISTSIGLFMGKGGLIVISCSAIFFALIFGTILTTVGDVFKKNVSYITGVILMFSYLVSTAVSFCIGILNDIVGVQAAYAMIPLSLIICCISASNIKKNVEYKLSNVNKVS
ncbi:MFS transporter [Tepidibacter hydrothermalis]|uniref:MFS transporter n=1 Tax=Tepidibacter hydrothermalis TaxID=3036126 RepID=A0ABY8EFP5_9FIRM|nr:MFS transporter [Tepidibacter hydrothermalis]WFD10574.1 MFS transporter [Tepidibacter hydrothermalis]